MFYNKIGGNREYATTNNSILVVEASSLWCYYVRWKGLTRHLSSA